MTYRVQNLTLMVAALQILFGGAAQASTNLLQCQAKTLRCESRFYRCLSRCDRQVAARTGLSTEDAQATSERCDGRCTATYSRQMTYIESVPPCHDVVITPDPVLCQAFYLNAEANLKICQARCADREDPSSCLSGCDTRHQTTLDQLNASPVCKDGRAGSSLAPVQN